jgi:O-antigen/teichoic acid export membrane protein
MPDVDLSPSSSRSLGSRLGLARAMFTGDFARKGYLSAVDQGLISLANFVTAIILARQITPSEFGIYAVGFAALHLVRAVLEGLVIQPLNALGSPMDMEAFRAYAGASGAIQAVLAGGMAAAALALGWGLTRMGNDTAGPAIAGMWFMILMWPLQDYIRRVFYARNMVLNAVINTGIASAARIGVLWALILRGNITGISGMDAIGWGALAGFIFGLVQARGFLTRKIGSLREAWARNWAAGRWVLGGSVANWVALEVYPILAAGMISFAAAGVYRALQIPVAPVHVILRAADTFVTPRAAAINARDGLHGVNRILRLAYLLVGVPILLLLLVVVIFAEPILSALFGETYQAYGAGMGLIAVFYLLWYLYWPLQSVMKGLGRTIPVFAANLAATVVMFTVGLVLIRQWGLYGTIAGQALNALVVNMVLWTSWVRYRKTG